MDRSIIYPMEQTRGYDLVSFEHDVLVGLSSVTQDVLGQPITVVAGCSASSTNPASLAVSLLAGRIYSIVQTDATGQGDIVADSNTVMQQGLVAAQSVTLSTTGLSPGQSRWALIQCTLQQTDVVRSVPSADPNGGVMAFYNTAAPQQPLNGQNGTGGVLPTARLAVGTVSVIYGTAAATGTEVPPLPSANSAPMYLIDLSYGQQQIISSQILVAGPSVGTGVSSTYPVAPFLAGLLSSHHSGNPGQAPKVNLATETQGSLTVAQGGTGGSTPLSARISLQTNDSYQTTLQSSYTVTNNDQGRVYYFGGSGIVVTLPTGLTAGTSVSFFSNYAGTIQTSGSAVIYGYPDWSQTSIGVLPGSYLTFMYDGSSWLLKHWNAPPGLYIQRLVFTASGTYNPSTFARNVRVQVQGAGGAGGGTAANSSGSVTVASGGNGGDYAVGWRPAVTTAITVGAGGTGVSGTNGNAGGNSSFDSEISAYGGSGGLTGTSNATSVATSNYTYGTITQTVDFYRPGDIGQIGVGTANAIAGGAGGNSLFGGGAAWPSSGTVSHAGGNATGLGGGGSGAAATGTTAAQAGGNGGNGVVIIDEYT